MVTELDRLLEEAEQQPFEGWDFSWLAGRVRVEPLRLMELHTQILSDGPLMVCVPHFWLEARKPES